VGASITHQHQCDAAGAQTFQTHHLGLQIVGLDVQVHAAGVIHLLQQDERLVRSGLQRGVFTVAVLIGVGNWFAEGLAPESDGFGQIIDVAVDHDGAESAVMHGNLRWAWMWPF
jgi:hypothetical protein